MELHTLRLLIGGMRKASTFAQVCHIDPNERRAATLPADAEAGSFAMTLWNVEMTALRFAGCFWQTSETKEKGKDAGMISSSRRLLLIARAMQPQSIFPGGEVVFFRSRLHLPGHRDR